jgi:predicted phosphodiesterase
MDKLKKILNSNHCDKVVNKYGLKIQIASDLHIELIDKNKQMRKFLRMIKPSAPYLALMGDICYFQDYDLLYDIFNNLSILFKKIIYIPGNHEYYTKVPEDYKYLLYRAKSIAKGTNVIILDNDVIMLEGVKIIGSTLWSNIPRIHYQYMKNYMNDYKEIYKLDDNKIVKINPEDTVNLHKESIKFIQKELYKSYDKKEKVLILTHHAPLTRNTSSEKYEGRIGNTGFATNLDYLFFNNINTWIFGHTHYTCNFKYKNTNIISNPKGYSSDKCSYKKDYVIFIR